MDIFFKSQYFCKSPSSSNVTPWEREPSGGDAAEAGGLKVLVWVCSAFSFGQTLCDSQHLAHSRAYLPIKWWVNIDTAMEVYKTRTHTHITTLFLFPFLDPSLGLFIKTTIREWRVLGSSGSFLSYPNHNLCHVEHTHTPEMQGAPTLPLTLQHASTGPVCDTPHPCWVEKSTHNKLEEMSWEIFVKRWDNVNISSNINISGKITCARTGKMSMSSLGACGLKTNSEIMLRIWP